ADAWGSKGGRRGLERRPPGSDARVDTRWHGSLRRRPRLPAGSLPARSTGRSCTATRTRSASAWAGTLDHASGPPSRAGSWSTSRLAGGPDAIRCLAGVWLVQLDAAEQVRIESDRLRSA